MRTFFTAVITLLIAGSACAQFKVNQTSTAGSQAATTVASANQSIQTARRISRDEAVKMVKEGKAAWIDVRARDQYDLGHIPGAISIPLAELPQNFTKLPVKKFLITYCA